MKLPLRLRAFAWLTAAAAALAQLACFAAGVAALVVAGWQATH